MIVAIDGPAAAGKGTLARRLADHFGLAHLDTGLLYRAVGRLVLDRGAASGDPEAAAAAARSLRPADLERDDLRDESAGAAASEVAAVPSVRAALLDFQREFAAHPPEGRRGAVLDGRDIGTVILPDAPVKLFVTASAEARSGRRHRELLARGAPSIYARVLADVKKRDERDSGRDIAPLKPAADAFVLDTTDLDADASFAAALAYIRSIGLGNGV